ncbi:hypothetical protein SteCoe_30139 [Stentor coeruleus]|uniref:Uncharacterized protein n=1 Tax=Stentor coeruleus TaxID=5963 RepID=A0A1R2B493_9CILI|nr:hypothetical protein SteCoe_30139 [Stentor coeruleus]
MGSGTEVKIYGDFSSDRYKCEVLLDDINDKWSNEGCEVLKSTDNYAIVNLKHLSIFKLINDDSLCETGKGPITIMSIILFMIISFGITLIIIHGKKKELKPLNKFLVIYPISSMFLNQNTLRKAAVMMQFFTSELFLLALIGAFMYYFDSPSEYTTYKFEKYTSYQLSGGAISWALCQIYTLPVFYLNSLGLWNSRFKFIYALTISISIFITICCSIGVIIMTMTYCGGWTELWTITFLIFTLFDWVSLEIIYSFILWLMYREQGSVYDESRYSRNKVTFMAVSYPTENETDREKVKIFEEEELENNEPENESIKKENFEINKLDNNDEINKISILGNTQNFDKQTPDEYKESISYQKYAKNDIENERNQILENPVKNTVEVEYKSESSLRDADLLKRRRSLLENVMKFDIPKPEYNIERPKLQKSETKIAFQIPSQDKNSKEKRKSVIEKVHKFNDLLTDYIPEKPKEVPLETIKKPDVPDTDTLKNPEDIIICKNAFEKPIQDRSSEMPRESIIENVQKFNVPIHNYQEEKPRGIILPSIKKSSMPIANINSGKPKVGFLEDIKKGFDKINIDFDEDKNIKRNLEIEDEFEIPEQDFNQEKYKESDKPEPDFENTESNKSGYSKLFFNPNIIKKSTIKINPNLQAFKIDNKAEIFRRSTLGSKAYQKKIELENEDIKNIEEELKIEHKNFEQEHQDENIKKHKRIGNKIKISKLKKNPERHKNNPFEKEDQFEISEVISDKKENELERLGVQQKLDIIRPNRGLENFKKEEESKNKLDVPKADGIIGKYKENSKKCEDLFDEFDDILLD